MFRVAWILILVVPFQLTVACSNGLSEYSDQMNPIFQDHMDEYAKLSDVIDSLYTQGLTMIRSQYSPGQKADEAMRLMADVDSSLGKYEHNSAEHLQEWIGLDPPDAALRFHELTFEMMQLRYAAVVLLQPQAAMLSSGQFDIDSSVLKDAGEKFDRSDRLLIQVLAEAKELED